MNVSCDGALQRRRLRRVLVFKNVNVAQQKPHNARIRRKRSHEGVFESRRQIQHGLARHTDADKSRRPGQNDGADIRIGQEQAFGRIHGRFPPKLRNGASSSFMDVQDDIIVAQKIRRPLNQYSTGDRRALHTDTGHADAGVAEPAAVRPHHLNRYVLIAWTFGQHRIDAPR
jgi:hypothetical protein